MWYTSDLVSPAPQSTGHVAGIFPRPRSVEQLEGEFPLRDWLTNGIRQNACFLEQLATGRVRKALSCFQSATRRRPIVLTSEWPSVVHEPE